MEERMGAAAPRVGTDHYQRMPTVLSEPEIGRLLAGMEGTCQLMAALIYGAGLRLRECLRRGSRMSNSTRGS